jgi:hypothetical protein
MPREGTLIVCEMTWWSPSLAKIWDIFESIVVLHLVEESVDEEYFQFQIKNQCHTQISRNFFLTFVRK